MRKAKKKLNPLQNQTLGDAHFATPEEVQVAGLVAEKGIRLGYYKAPEDRSKDWGEVMRYGGDAHLITVAPTRSGKGRDVLIPALLEYPGSCIVIDPKGQLAAVTKAHRERPVEEGGLGQEVIVLNPFNLLSDELGPTSQYNPITALDPDADSFGADCDSLAEAIVVRDGHGEPHWPDSARQLISGMIMHMVANESPEFQNFAAIQSLVSGPASDLCDFVKDAVEADEEGFITSRLARFQKLNDESREATGIVSAAITQTGFIANKAIARSLSNSDFRFRDLKERPITVYLVLPAKQIETCGKWFRLIVASALAELCSEMQGKVPVLAILDEFAQLNAGGRLTAIENAMAMAAGFGLQLWPILQDLGQLKDIYGDRWETFLANSVIQQFFGPRDEFTADHISKLCGVKTVVTHGQSVQHAADVLQKDQTGSSWGQQSQPLLHPHNLRNLGPNECLILGPQNVVIDTLRKPYFRTEELKGMWSPDPYHKADAKKKSEAGTENLEPPPNTLAEKDAAAARATETALVRRRALPIRFLTWRSSDNPIVNVSMKIEYILTLPLRLVGALLALPFAIHSRPLGAALGLLALFGFWEVWNDFAKTPILAAYREKSLEFQQEAIKNDPASAGDMLNSNYKAAKWLIGATVGGLSRGSPTDRARPSAVSPPPSPTTGIIGAVDKAVAGVSEKADIQMRRAKDIDPVSEEHQDETIRRALANLAPSVSRQEGITLPENAPALPPIEQAIGFEAMVRGSGAKFLPLDEETVKRVRLSNAQRGKMGGARIYFTRQFEEDKFRLSEGTRVWPILRDSKNYVDAGGNQPLILVKTDSGKIGLMAEDEFESLIRESTPQR